MGELSYQQLLNVNLNSGSSPRLRDQVKTARACRDFEALFTEQVLKEMRTSLGQGSSDLPASPLSGDSFYADMLYKNYASEIAQQSPLGLGESLFRQSLDLEQAVNRYQDEGRDEPSVSEHA